MKPKKIKEIGKTAIKSMKLIWHTDRLRTAALMVFVPVQGIAPLLASIAVSYVINALTRGDAYAHILMVAVLWGFFTLLGNVLQPVAMQLQGELSDRLSHQIHIRLFDQSMRIEDLSTAENASYCDEVQIIQDEVAWRPVNLVIFSLSVLRALLTVIFIMVSLCAFHPLITIVMLISLLPQSVVLYRLQQESFENMVERSPLARNLKYHAEIMLSQAYAKELRLFRYGRYIKAQYEDTFQKIFQTTQKIRKKKTRASVLLFVVGTLGCMGSLIAVVRMASDGMISVGGVTLFASYILIASTTLITLMQESALLYDTLLFMNKFFAFCEEPLKMEEGQAHFDEQGITEIQFQNVSFRYPDTEKSAVSHVSFTLKKGKSIALVGENGSGKSTIMKLLCRFYDPDEGKILINGRDIRAYRIAALREQISIAFQDFASYDLTVRENVILADVSRKERAEEVNEALRQGGACGFVERLAGGKEQLLGRRFDGGVELSGGEWQKLSVARAFFKRGTLFLFDEPSSALDARSEEAFWNSVRRTTQDKLSLWVTHRLAFVHEADEILVLERGEIVERGKHEALMEKGGLYAEMYCLQSEQYKMDI